MTTTMVDLTTPGVTGIQGEQLQLDAERSVSFKDRGNAFTYFFRRISDADWRKFFGGISMESERVGSARTDRFDFRTPGLQLVDDCLQRVEGYHMRDGGDVAQLSGWKQRLPYGHRLKAAELLQDVTISTADREYFFEPDVDEVVLDAAWGGAAGAIVKYVGLVHRFKPATAEHQRRFSRATSEARVVGGSRAGRTIYPGRHALLADLYDELVVGVDGYACGGQPLTAAESIRRDMDTFHKVSAVQQLFAAPDSPAEEEAA